MGHRAHTSPLFESTTDGFPLAEVTVRLAEPHERVRRDATVARHHHQPRARGHHPQDRLRRHRLGNPAPRAPAQGRLRRDPVPLNAAARRRNAAGPPAPTSRVSGPESCPGRRPRTRETGRRAPAATPGRGPDRPESAAIGKRGTPLTRPSTGIDTPSEAGIMRAGTRRIDPLRNPVRVPRTPARNGVRHPGESRHGRSGPTLLIHRHRGAGARAVAVAGAAPARARGKSGGSRSPPARRRVRSGHHGTGRPRAAPGTGELT